MSSSRQQWGESLGWSPITTARGGYMAHIPLADLFVSTFKEFHSLNKNLCLTNKLLLLFI